MLHTDWCIGGWRWLWYYICHAFEKWRWSREWWFLDAGITVVVALRCLAIV